MTTAEKVDERCLQLLGELSSCVNGALAHQKYDVGTEEQKIQRAVVDRRAACIHDTLSTLLSNLNASRNSFSPISKLVDEILIEIWSYASIYELFSIAEVCRHWRRISLNAAKLWTEFNLDVLMGNKIQLALKRSGNAPLRIVAVNSRPFKETSVEQYYQSQRYSQRVDERGWCESGRRATMVNEEADYKDERGSKEEDPSFFGFHRPLPSIPLDAFERILPRARSIRGTMGGDDTSYISHRSLKHPMPFLRDLSITGQAAWGNPALDNITRQAIKEGGKWFSGFTPLLKEVDLSHVHAPWDDPIYSNLTHLRLNSPFTRILVSELLRILKHCPTLEYLDIVNCLSLNNVTGFGHMAYPPVHTDDRYGDEAPDYLSPAVALNKLRYLHLDEHDSTMYAKFLSRISCPALQTVVICAPRITCLTRSTSHGDGQHTLLPFESIQPVFAKTTQLQLSLSEWGQFTAIGRTNEVSNHDHHRFRDTSGNIRRSPGPGWSFSSKHTLSHHSPRPEANINHHIQFIQQLEVAGLLFDQIELVDITGQTSLGTEFYQELFARCSHLKRLHIRPWPKFITVNGGGFGGWENPALSTRRFNGESGVSILGNVLGTWLCPELEQIYLTQFSSSAHRLAEWVELRAKKCKRLKRVVVDVFNDLHDNMQMSECMEDSSILDWESKTRIEKALEEEGEHVRSTAGPSGGNDGSDAYGFVWRNSEKKRFLEHQNRMDDEDQARKKWSEWL
ncbi:hypothetical protein FRC18_000544 [Serendipita sp. 400]|nr:hypothetical protein FRC18_000544 [Serendipita sp. 400]